MRTLIVTAVSLEAQLLVEKLALLPVQDKLYSDSAQKYYLLITGIGMTNTTLALSRTLALMDFDTLINVGVCGAYNKTFELTQVVEVTEETFAELGVETEDNFLTLDELGFELFNIGGKQYYNTIENPVQATGLFRTAKGLTANTVTGTDEMAFLRHKRWQKDIETMESAAFFQTALLFQKKFIALRSVSNYVEKRDLSRWHLREAALNAQNAVLSLI